MQCIAINLLFINELYFPTHRKVRNRRAEFCAFRPNMKKILKNFKKILIVFHQNPYEKLTFSEFFPNYFLEFCLLSESIYPLKITPDF